MSIASVIPSNDLNLCCPFLPPLIFASIRVFSNESVLGIRWPKYQSFSFSISLSNEYSGLISLRMDWFNLPAVQETLKSLLQHHSSKASILWNSAFFMVHLSNHSFDYMDLCWKSNVSAFFISFISTLMFQMLCFSPLCFLYFSVWEQKLALIFNQESYTNKKQELKSTGTCGHLTWVRKCM